MPTHDVQISLRHEENLGRVGITTRSAQSA